MWYSWNRQFIAFTLCSDSTQVSEVWDCKNPSSFVVSVFQGGGVCGIHGNTGSFRSPLERRAHCVRLSGSTQVCEVSDYQSPSTFFVPVFQGKVSVVYMETRAYSVRRSASNTISDILNRQSRFTFVEAVF